MGRSKAILLLLVAMLFGLFAMVAVSKQMGAGGLKAKSKGTDIVIAAREVVLGKKLEAEDLAAFCWPGKPPFVGTFAKTEDLIDRVIKTPLVKGEPIFEGKLAPEGSREGLGARIPKGMRALTVPVSKSTQAGSLLFNGCHVDVLTTMQSGGFGSQQITKTILQNVEVLCVGVPGAEDDAKATQNYGNTTVILLVSPTDAQKLALAIRFGRIDLTVREQTDTDMTKIAKTQVVDLLPEQKKPKVEPKEITEPVKVEPKGPTGKEMYNEARGLMEDGKPEEAISRFKKLIAEHPRSDSAVEARKQIRTILAEQNLRQQQQACAQSLAQLRQTLKDGAFKEATKQCAQIGEQYGQLTLQTGESVQDILKTIHNDLGKAEREADRIFQLFNNALKLHMIDTAQDHYNRLLKKFPKSSYTQKAKKMLENAQQQ